MSELTSIVIPVHGRAALTRQCIETILGEPPGGPFEIVVVDDASPDMTAEMLAAFGDPVRVVSRAENGGFATACNDGAAEARGAGLVFLNNDTIPKRGWLDALVEHAARNPKAAVVGSRLLFPNDSIQHAGVVICQDGNPRHIYAGFPADHPVVNVSRRFQAVTAACMLVRRTAFDEAGGFDPVFRNCLEDVDLCLKIGERGHEVHYCHQSVLYHLESVSRGRRSKEIERNARIFRERWGDKARRDDLDYYVSDGLLSLHYRDVYPLGIEASPLLALAADGEAGDERDRMLNSQSREIVDLLRETIRLTAHVAELELAAGMPSSGVSTGRAAPEGGPPARDPAAPATPLQQRLLEQARDLELEIYDMQVALAEGLSSNGAAGDDRPARPPFVPAEQFGYKRMLAEIRAGAQRATPPGSVVVVISRGDDELTTLPERTGWHFPQDERGTFLGHYPESSGDVIDHLDALRDAGADYLLVPATASWWLDHYADFGRHVRERHIQLAAEDAPFELFDLKAAREG